jgi:tetratricopeptide (TPR) repeat protein
MALLVLFSVSYASEVYQRNPQWANNTTLFLADVQRVPNSAKAQKAAAEVLLARARTKTPVDLADVQAARQHAVTALAILPGYPEALQNLGSAWFYQDSLLRAEAVWDSLHQQPEGARYRPANYLALATAWSKIAAEHATQQRYPQAVPTYRKALQFCQGEACAFPHSQLGLVFGVLQELDSAIVHLQAATALQPQSVAYWADLGGACYTAKRYAEAKAAWQKALALDPNNQLAKMGLQALP